MPRKTPAVARALGVTYHRLINLIRIGKISSPQKDTSGDYLWTDSDLGAARKALTVDRVWKEARR
jgi:hypothetical protein